MSTYRSICSAAIAVAFTVMALAMPAKVLAGIYDDEGEVTYKEYWVPHENWPSYVLDDAECNPLYREWFIEATRRCEAQTTFDLPDDVSSALRAEIYLDLWRAYVEQASKFKLNNSQLYKADVGLDWSRTPYIGPIDLADIERDANTFLLPKTRPHHTHDIAIRVYYDDSNPIIPGPGSDVTAPTGQLLSVRGDDGAIDAATGGTLTVDGDQVTLTAEVDADAAFVEFHGYYFGYDEDNNGKYLDWHSRGRNNCHPGGARFNKSGGIEYRCPYGNPDGGQYGTIDHIGTVKTTGAGQYSVTWDVSTVVDQDDVRFKIRVVDAQGNVRDATARYRQFRSGA